MHLLLRKQRVEKALKEYLKNEADSTELFQACKYALESKAKRLRPIIVLIVAEALGKENVMAAALGAEFFHTASLIPDDLPCMDNDSFRRGRPALHKAFPESTALLASYTLISWGYGSLVRAAEELKGSPKFQASANERAMACLRIATDSAGLKGATGGQFLDLKPQSLTFESLQEIMRKKTGTLFEVSFLFGWLMGGGDFLKIPSVKKSAYHLGMAFQIADDLEDLDKQSVGMNVASILGVEKAFQLFENEMSLFEKELKGLSLFTPSFQEIVEKLASRCQSFF